MVDEARVWLPLKPPRLATHRRYVWIDDNPKSVLLHSSRGARIHCEHRLEGHGCVLAEYPDVIGSKMEAADRKARESESRRNRWYWRLWRWLK